MLLDDLAADVVLNGFGDGVTVSLHCAHLSGDGVCD
jgi:hypothetical protein